MPTVPEDNIVIFNGATHLDLPPDRILEKAKGELKGVMVLGYTKDDVEWLASSFADVGTCLLLMERCKKRLIDAFDED